jgi:hypothetical protein
VTSPWRGIQQVLDLKSAQELPLGVFVPDIRIVGSGFIQQLGDVLPHVFALMGDGQREHHFARLIQRRDGAAVL